MRTMLFVLTGMFLLCGCGPDLFLDPADVQDHPAWEWKPWTRPDRPNYEIELDSKHAPPDVEHRYAVITWHDQLEKDVLLNEAKLIYESFVEDINRAQPDAIHKRINIRIRDQSLESGQLNTLQVIGGTSPTLPDWPPDDVTLGPPFNELPQPAFLVE